jgi:hypothetical protein
LDAESEDDGWIVYFCFGSVLNINMMRRWGFATLGVSLSNSLTEFCWVVQCSPMRWFAWCFGFSMVFHSTHFVQL